MSSDVVTIPVRLEIRGIAMTGVEQAATIFRAEFLDACQDIGLHVSERIKQIMRGKGHGHGLWNTGDLINSITWSLTMATGTALGVVVGTNLEYGRYKEFGTVPHFVPFHLAKSLYDEARGDWGWLPVDKRTREYKGLQSQANPAVQHGPGGLKTVTGRRRTYVLTSTDRLWLRPSADAKPVWGVHVSGKAEPFMYPGWEASVEYCEKRLLEAAQRAGQRISAGG